MNKSLETNATDRKVMINVKFKLIKFVNNPRQGQETNVTEGKYIMI